MNIILSITDSCISVDSMQNRTKKDLEDWSALIAEILILAFANKNIALSFAYFHYKSLEYFDGIRIDYELDKFKYSFKYIANCPTEYLKKITGTLESVRILKIDNSEDTYKYADLYREDFRIKVSRRPYEFVNNSRLVHTWPTDVQMINMDGDGYILCWYGISQDIIQEYLQKVRSICIDAGCEVIISNNDNY